MSKLIKGLLVFCGYFFLYHIVMSSFFPVDEYNVLQVPDWYSAVGIIFALCITIFTLNWKKKESKFNVSEALKKITKRPAADKPFTVPLTKKKQTELAARILENITVCVSLANKSTNVSRFVDWYDEALGDFSKLMQLKKVKFKGSPALDYYTLKDEFQLHLCDAIVRAKENALSEICSKYKNSLEFQARALESFQNDLSSVQNRFSTGTSALADKSVQEIQRHLNLQPVSPMSTPYKLEAVDGMDGHAFEFWCADLLKKNGFVNVEVTPGSGDQGVDILAEKDGIKYAIQCKCYSSDLGNTPVQEVNAGKMVYNCQIGVVMTNRYFTKGARDAAKATGVLLWDREKIQQMVSVANA